jgi:hypothetical protein
MHHSKLTIALPLSALLFTSAFANAQGVTGRSTTTVEAIPGTGTTTTQTVTTTSAGLISEMGPDGLVVRTESGAPVRYSSSASTVYIDEAGRPVARELVTSGVPVTVHYTRDGERFLADRVVVRRQTTTTTPAPTVIERNTTITRPPVVVEKPVIVEKKVYVDRPVAVEKKVYVDRPVIVEKPVVVERPVVVEKPVPAPVVVEKKTTTTTTTKSKKDRNDD